MYFSFSVIFSILAAFQVLQCAFLTTYCKEHYAGYEFNVKSVGTHSVFDDMETIAGAQPFDMICLPNKHKNVFARVFNPSLAHKILFRADIPMMVIPV